VLRPALVALDLHLPGLDGLQVCRRIREHPALAGTRIVAMTADSREGIPQQLREAGADAVLLKPFPFEKFCEAARIAVRGRPARPAVDRPPDG
jgi:two-component system phosphate regulon response regulator PhoB